jgi:2-alkenal reductase
MSYDLDRPPPRPTPPSRRGLGLLLAGIAVLAVGGALLAGAAAGGLTAWWLLGRAPVAALPPAGASGVDRLSTAPADASDATVLAAVRATRPAVVTVWNLQRVRDRNGVRLAPVSSGSGVIFDARGYIATNTHVLEGAEAVQVVFLDGRRAVATLVDFEPRYDVALLRVDAAMVPAVAPLADSTKLEPGMRVLAIGSPLGTEYQNTVTQGIIAGLNRRVKEPRFDWSTFSYQEEDVVGAPLIQTDAAINTGNSGGPLVSLGGEVVGLNTLIVRGDGRSSFEGLGFAIPANVVRALADEWIDHQPRGSLGIEFETLDPLTAAENNLERGSGALVTSVRFGSSAAAAGLQVGDVIAAIDGVNLDLDHALADLLWRYRSGDRIRLVVERGGERRELEVPLESAPESSR